MRKLSFWGVLIFGLFLYSNCLASTYDASAQFDTNNNPSSVGSWSYGYASTLGGAFILFDYIHSSSTFSGWSLPTYYPDVKKHFNADGTDDLTLAPGFDGENAVVRWIAPNDGIYTIDVTFTGFYDGEYIGAWTSADVHLLYNNTSLFDSVILGHASDTHVTTLDLNAGDIIDFVVGDHSNGMDWDRVILDATISEVIPEEQVETLVSTVISLNLANGVANSLDSKLNNALGALEDLNENNDIACINSLYAFINAVEAQRGNKISEADADELIAATFNIINQLESE